MSDEARGDQWGVRFINKVQHTEEIFPSLDRPIEEEVLTGGVSVNKGPTEEKKWNGPCLKYNQSQGRMHSCKAFIYAVDILIRFSLLTYTIIYSATALFCCVSGPLRADPWHGCILVEVRVSCR